LNYFGVGKICPASPHIIGSKVQEAKSKYSQACQGLRIKEGRRNPKWKFEIRPKIFCLENFKEGQNLGCYRPSLLIWNLVPRFKLLMGLLGIPDLNKTSIFPVVSFSAIYCAQTFWNSIEVAGVVYIPGFAPLTCWLLFSKCTNSALLFGVNRVTSFAGDGVAAFTSLGGSGWEDSLLLRLTR